MGIRASFRVAALASLCPAMIALSVASSGCAARVDRFEVKAPSGVGAALNVSNPHGGVSLRVDPSVDDLSVRAVVQRDASIFSPAAEPADPDAIDVYAETIADEHGRSVTHIIARSVADNPGVRVGLEIVTPRCDGVRIDAAGDVVLKGTRGALQVETTRGAIDVRTDHPLTDPVALVTGGGNVYLTAPPASRGAITLESSAGQARVYSVYPGMSGARSTPDSFSGVLNRGENPVLLRTERGNAFLRLHEAPMTVVRTIR